MKRNLIKGIILIGAVALSSCSATKLASIKSDINDDDVYYTRAKAGDVSDYIAANTQRTYNGDDDYYYYGDYASRIARFNNPTPFDYDDNFYFTYVPYNNGFGQGLEYDPSTYNYSYLSNNTANNNTTANTNTYADNGYVYNPYNYGYSPYDMGYDDYGYGNIYSAFMLDGGYYGGGGGGSFYGGTGSFRAAHKNSGTTVTGIGFNPNVRGIRTTQSPGVTRIAAALPGRPAVSVNTNTGVVTRVNLTSVNGNNNTASRQTRDSYSTQQQTMTSRPMTSTVSPSSTSSSSTSSAASSGGGGRPGRP